MGKGMERQDLKNFTLQQLEKFVSHWGRETYRAKQIFKWIYQKGVNSFEEMTDISKDFRSQLSQLGYISCMSPKNIEISQDGAKKFFFELDGRDGIEAVLIPQEERMTLCLSTQRGCLWECRFCLTGKLGFQRNLKASEMVNQVLGVKKSLKEGERITNIVFMGMGEPLANFESLKTTLHILTNPYGFDFSARRITISTAGLVPGIIRLAKESIKANLAISLNAATDEVRDFLMPINKKYPLKALMEALRRYPLPSGRRITFEYVLIKGVNDSLEDTKALASLLKGIPCKINLIPFNEYAGCEFKRPKQTQLEKFQNMLLLKNYCATIRNSRGVDIGAACGQLRGSLC